MTGLHGQEKKSDDIFSCFDTIHTCDGHPDGQRVTGCQLILHLNRVLHGNNNAQPEVCYIQSHALHCL